MIILRHRLISFFRFLQFKYALFLFSILFLACQTENENEAQIEAIPVQVALDRFDLKFYNQPSYVIPELKKQYPFLFPNFLDKPSA